MNYQLFPNLTSEEYEELKNDIRERGVQIPIELDEEGNILDGHHRKKICEELGIIDYGVVVRYGLSDEEKRLHVRKLNLARRHLNQSQKRALIEEQLKDTPGISDRQIARSLNVDNSTVSRTREKLVENGQLLHCNSSLGADGKTRPRRAITTRADEVEKVAEIREKRPKMQNRKSFFRAFPVSK